MSGALAAVATAGGIAATFIGPILLRAPRMIDTIVPDCAVEEYSVDNLSVTKNPVEQGAAISDHCFKEPAEVILRYGFSNSSAANPLIPNIGGEDYVIQVYEGLLQLQARRVPFDIVTGKRQYTNMLLTSLAQTTDHTTEYSLMVVARCNEVIITQTTAVSAPPNLQAQNQADPASTSATQQSGDAQTQPVAPAKQSVLSTIAQGIGATGGAP